MVCTHPYQGEDEEELTFEKGVVISVIPYDDPDNEVGHATAFNEDPISLLATGTPVLNMNMTIITYQ